jgi:hypothetical protein
MTGLSNLKIKMAAIDIEREAFKVDQASLKEVVSEYYDQFPRKYGRRYHSSATRHNKHECYISLRHSRP